jgi:hypothetical protein
MEDRIYAQVSEHREEGMRCPLDMFSVDWAVELTFGDIPGVYVAIFESHTDLSRPLSDVTRRAWPRSSKRTPAPA